VSTFEFVFALAVITLLAMVVTVLSYLSGKQSLACCLFLAFTFRDADQRLFSTSWRRSGYGRIARAS